MQCSTKRENNICVQGPRLYVLPKEAGIEILLFMSLLRSRMLRVVNPTQHVHSIVFQSQACLSFGALRSRLISPRHQQTIRSLTATSLLRDPPSSHPSNGDRGPASEEESRTDFSSLDVLANSPPPATAVETCLSDGFDLSNGVMIRDSGCLLVGGEAFEWRPWQVTTPRRSIFNTKGQWDVAEEAWALLEVVWPRPGE